MGCGEERQAGIPLNERSTVDDSEPYEQAKTFVDAARGRLANIQAAPAG